MNDRFERLLKSRIGLDASSVGSAVIERAVRQRMSGLALHDEDEYWMRLNGSPGEVQALIEAVVVPETWFFRYPESSPPSPGWPSSACRAWAADAR